MPVHTSLLQQFALLKHLSDLALEEVALHASLKQFSRREVIVDRETSPLSLFFLLEGRLQATDFTLDGKEVGLYFLEAGQYFGEVAMFDGLAHSEIIIATKKSQVVQIPNRIIRPQILKHSQSTESIAIGLACRLRQQTRQRQILSINNPLQRVGAQLLLLLPQLTEQSDSVLPGHLIAHLPTHQELAIMSNLSRETVTRVFQALQTQGVLDRQSESFIIHIQKIKDIARHAE